jgi:hypothetical protein
MVASKKAGLARPAFLILSEANGFSAALGFKDHGPGGPKSLCVMSQPSSQRSSESTL